MRALGIFHTMGFRHFDLFGFDSSMEEPTKEQQKETTGAEDEEPRPKYFKVGVGEQYFWTTGELLAMAQDCERTFNNPPMEMNLNLYGEDTLVTALWNVQPKKPNLRKLLMDNYVLPKKPKPSEKYLELIEAYKHLHEDDDKFQGISLIPFAIDIYGIYYSIINVNLF